MSTVLDDARELASWLQSEVELSLGDADELEEMSARADRIAHALAIVTGAVESRRDAGEVDVGWLANGVVVTVRRFPR